MLPLDELRQIDSQVESATEVSALRPLYDRLGEISRTYTADFDLQLAVGEARQRVIDKGIELKRLNPNGSGADSRASAVIRGPLPVERRLGPEPEVVREPLVEPPPRPVTKPLDLRRTLITGAALGVTAWLIIFVVLVQIARNRNMPAAPRSSTTVVGNKPPAGTVPVDIVTVPAGASVQVNGEARCNSNCRLNLAPGNYQVTAVLDGFDPGATGVTVVAGNPISVNLRLVSQTQTVRVLTDLEAGRVILDGQPAGELQDGQLVLDRISNGKHALRIVGKNGEAAFAFEGASGKEPLINGPVAATNMLAVLVTSLGNQANVRTSASTPVKVDLNGKTQGEAGLQGLELKDVPAGDQTLAVSLGQEQRKLVVSFGPTPMLTAFIKSDVNTGTLVVSTGEDDVAVFLNGKEYKRKTKRGELRVHTVGAIDVRVFKSGFQPEPNQRVEVKKGEEVKLAFTLKPLPKVAALQIRNGISGTQIFLDDRALGRVGPDGALSAGNLSPGEHAIEARRDGFTTRRILRTLKAGETLAINGTEIVLPAAIGTLQVSTTPPDATVVYRRGDETQTHIAAHGIPLKLDPGSYVVTARAPNFVERTERVTIAAGDSHNLEIALARDPGPLELTKPKPKAPASINWAGWTQENGEYVHRGGNRVVLRSGPLEGTITFTAHLRKAGGLFRGGKVRWFVEDAGGVSQFEVDRKKFQARGPEGSRSRDHSRDTGEADDRTYTIQVEVTPDRIVHRMKIGESWITMDSQPAKGAADGRFGFVIPGSDEIGISDLRFTPK